MEIRDKIKLIADTYGYDEQSRQCIEEMAELTQAINKFWRKDLKCGQLTILEVPVGSPCEKNLLKKLQTFRLCYGKWNIC